LPTTGVIEIAFVPPANTGTGRDVGSRVVIFVLLILSSSLARGARSWNADERY
jgi:hypothetical protein